MAQASDDEVKSPWLPQHMLQNLPSQSELLGNFREYSKKASALIVHKTDCSTSPTKSKFLKDLDEALGDVKLFDLVEEEVEQVEGIRKLGKLQKCLDETEKVILAFPRNFGDAQLVQAINKSAKSSLEMVMVIMSEEEYVELPTEIDEFNIKRHVIVGEGEREIEQTANEIKSFITGSPQNIKRQFLNFGNGLALSYYFGYLDIFLPDIFENVIMKSEWRSGNGKEVDTKKISKKMLIYSKLELGKEALEESGRLKFHENEVKMKVAGVDRRYEIDIREVRSEDCTEAYYGIADFANVLRLLVSLREGRILDFEMNEELMNRHGKYFAERLRLLLEGKCMKKYNKMKRIDSSKFQLVEFDGSVRNASAEDQVEGLFQRMRSICNPAETDVTRDDKPEPKPEELTVFCAGSDGQDLVRDVPDDVYRFIKKQLHISYKSIKNVQNITAIQGAKQVFMVITDELVTDSAFEDLFYRFLGLSYDEKNRRFLVVLDCLSENVRAGQPALLLLHLFKSVSYQDRDWGEKVLKELKGGPEPITFDVMFHNIGAGLALSFYNGFLRYRIPGMEGLVKKIPYFKKKYEAGLMSHKLFLLHPHSGKTGKTISEMDKRVVDEEDDVDLKKIKLEELAKVKNDRRKYHGKACSITDKDGEKYIVFVEYNTQAATLRKMVEAGILSESILSQEWSRLDSKLKLLISRDDRMRHGLQILSYDDINFHGNQLSDHILDQVKAAIKKPPPRANVQPGSDVISGKVIAQPKGDTSSTQQSS